jgi:hypothetical protein
MDCIVVKTRHQYSVPASTAFNHGTTVTVFNTRHNDCKQNKINRLNKEYTQTSRSQESVSDMLTMLWAGWPSNEGLINGRGKRFFFSPKCPDQFWGPPSLLLNSYQGYLNEMKAQTVWSWSLTSYCLHQRWIELYLHYHNVPSRHILLDVTNSYMFHSPSLYDPNVDYQYAN